MRWLWCDPDGGKESNSRIYGLEIKSLFSILVIRVKGPTRPVFHSHAFSAISWVLKGVLRERQRIWPGYNSIRHRANCRAIWTTWSTCHDVQPIPPESTTWVLHFRGPWRKQWIEIPHGGTTITTLSHGRQVVES